jgi:PAS domain S-box-containing protein
MRMDTEGKITFFNTYAQNFFGYREEEIIGKNVIGTIVPELNIAGFDLAVMIKDIGAHPERYVSNENENIRRNGERVQVTWMNKAIYDEAGNVSEILCVGIDVTEKWQLEKRLAQAQKMESIGTLAGGIAHDFNNILSAVIGYTELSLIDIPKGSALQNNLQQVLKAGGRAKDLVRQILTFSRQRENELVPVKVSLIVNEALKLLRSLPTDNHQNASSHKVLSGGSDRPHQYSSSINESVYQCKFCHAGGRRRPGSQSQRRGSGRRFCQTASRCETRKIYQTHR